MSQIFLIIGIVVFIILAVLVVAIKIQEFHLNKIEIEEIKKRMECEEEKYEIVMKCYRAELRKREAET